MHSMHSLGVSAGGTLLPGTKNRENCPDKVGGFSVEFGAGPIELASGFDTDHSELIPSVGISAGIGIKATVCYYRILEKEKIGCCIK